MKKFFLFCGSMAFSSSLFAGIFSKGPLCTNSPKNQWKDQNQFQNELKDKGYKIKKFKVTDRNCYYIEGTKDGKSVEAYFVPTDGTLAEEND